MPNLQSPREEKLLKLNAVLTRFPVSRSTWYNGIKNGRFPAPIKIGLRGCAWRKSDIDALIDECARGGVK
ncbi:AlpA family phage regulatory protein [Comamonas sp.]|uniref:helix-turn-helix transcriptional regulator n=1 Tax=Comamonas sp. TaxID=34028 RepID=UPI0028A1888F|nr:AlpA family phage regulatory protein [Comamonas sp.]